MLIKKNNNLYRQVFLSMFCLLVSFSGKAQNDPEAEARKLFDKGRFLEALPVFRNLTRQYPNDRNLNYYLGACLAETNQLNDEAKRALDIAKTEIPESYFYLGKYFHVRSDWKNAIQNYERFRTEARKKSVEASQVTELISMCRRMKNPFPVAEPKSEETFGSLTGKKELPAVSEPVAKIKEPVVSEPVVKIKEPVVSGIPPILKDSIIHFQVNAVVSYNKVDQFKFDSSKEAFIKGWLIEQDMQKKLNDLSNLRKEYGTLAGPEQDSLVDRILKLEQETYRMSQKALDAYQEANLKEAEFWNKAGALEVENFRREVNRIQDSVRTASEQRIRKQTEENILVILPDTAVITDTVTAVTPEPANEVVYKIQIGAYRNSPPEWVQGQFKKLAVIRRIDQRVDERGVTVYTVGELKSYDDALQMQKQIRMEGMKNAFVAAYLNNKRVSLEEAKKMTQ